MNRLTAIAVSGGIDSMVAAYLLKKRGHEVIGIHFLNGYGETSPGRSASFIASRIADRIAIPVEIFDCANDFDKKVTSYFVQTYLNGKTPNPCLVCNPAIKFGTLLEHARGLGADTLATGHYARTETDGSGRIHLLRGIDPAKDQSYFLSFLKQDQLASAIFPLGGMTKEEVRELAAARGLKPAIADESQDICFIKNETYGEFLVNRKGFKPRPGPIEDTGGSVIGEHRGLHLFTVGQRRGINCPAPEPYYVVRIDVDRNTLVVGFKKDLYRPECMVSGINWIGIEPDSPVRVLTRLRYRHKPVASTLHPEAGHTALVRFDEPEPAVTPGQGAVFYIGGEVLGGGFIES